jgi:hypothetical protein
MDLDQDPDREKPNVTGQSLNIGKYFKVWGAYCHSFLFIYTLVEQKYLISMYYPSSTLLLSTWLPLMAEQRFKLGPASQQVDALLSEPRRTLCEPRRTPFISAD